MKVKSSKKDHPNISIGMKRALLQLNYDLDLIKSSVESNSEYGFSFGHSIDAKGDLTQVELAVLYLEDRRFFSHSGIELISLLRGVKRFLQGYPLGGVSTIDQQVVRISLRRYERSFSRKLNELLLALIVNIHLPKKAIFNYYIHNAYLGYKIEGCEIAANKIFGNTAASLDANQAAFIASLFPLPFPKAVWEVYEVDPLYPFSSPEQILILAESVSPRWAERIKYRYRLAKKFHFFRPKSL